MYSDHYIESRSSREKLIASIGEGKIVDTFLVDKGHPNGPELHSLTDTGIIIIRNARTKKMVTKLIARPGQIRRYYNGLGQREPRWLMSIARKHQLLGYNDK